MAASRYLYLNGRLVPYDEARIHVQSGAVKYGGSVFEGLRAYWNADQGELYIFRLQEHIDRLFASLRLMRMEHRFTREELADSILQVLRKNEVRQDVHIRQSAFIEADAALEATGPVEDLAFAADGRLQAVAERRAMATVTSS